MSKKSIWCISKYASPPRYGVGARLFYVASEFCNIGADVILISSDSNHLAKYPQSSHIYNYEKMDQLSHIWIKTYKYKKSASLRRFISWIDFELKLFLLKLEQFKKPDVIIISSLSLSTIVYGIYLKKKYKCKLIFEIRDIYPLTLTEEFGVSKFHPVVICLGILERIGYRHADIIVGTMPNLKQHVKHITKEDKDVFYSPIGINQVWKQECVVNKKIDSLFPIGDCFFVGYAGSMGVSNALMPFANAIEKMAMEKKVHFVLVGDGDLKEEIKKQLGTLNNVTIGDKIPQNDIPYFLSKCDLLYLSTHDSKIWDYGQSMNKLIDYMMAGKPVVASYSGFPSMLNEANSGVFIPTGDVNSIICAINKFRSMSKEERIDYGLRGKLWVENNHNYSEISQKYYEKILELF